METGTRESGRPASGTVTELTSFPTVISTLASISTVSLKVMDSTNGSTEIPTKAPSKTASSTEMESGGKPWTLLFHQILKLTLMKVITKTIRKTAGATLSGSPATPTEVVMSMMKGRVLARCAGQTVPYIEAHGTKAFSMALASCCSQVVTEDAGYSCKIYSKRRQKSSHNLMNGLRHIFKKIKMLHNLFLKHLELK